MCCNDAVLSAAELIDHIPDEFQVQKLTAPVSTKAVSGCYTGDLLSDVLAHARAGQILVTVQAHANTIAVAETKKMPAVIFCNNRHPSPEVIQMAEERGVSLFVTSRTSFEISSTVAPFFLSETY